MTKGNVRIGGVNAPLQGNGELKIRVGRNQMKLFDYIRSFTRGARPNYLEKQLGRIAKGKAVTRMHGTEALTQLKFQIEGQELCGHSEKPVAEAAALALDFTQKEVEALEFPVEAPALPNQEQAKTFLENYQKFLDEIAKEDDLQGKASAYRQADQFKAKLNELMPLIEELAKSKDLNQGKTAKTLLRHLQRQRLAENILIQKEEGARLSVIASVAYELKGQDAKQLAELLLAIAAEKGAGHEEVREIYHETRVLFALHSPAKEPSKKILADPSARQILEKLLKYPDNPLCVQAQSATEDVTQKEKEVEEYEVVDKDEFDRIKRENEALQAEIARLESLRSGSAQAQMEARTTEMDIGELLMHERSAQAVSSFTPPADISERLAAQTQEEFVRSKQGMLDIFERVADMKTALKGNQAEIEMLTEDHKLAAQLIRDRIQEIEKELAVLAEEKGKKAQEARDKFTAELAGKISDPVQREEKKKEILSGKTPLQTVQQITKQYKTKMRAILNAVAVEFETDVSSAKTWTESLAIVKKAAEEKARLKEEEATKAFPEKREAIATLLDQIGGLSVQAEDTLQNIIKSITSKRIDFVLGSIYDNLSGMQDWFSGLTRFIEDVREAVAEEPEVSPAVAPPPKKKAAEPAKEPEIPPPPAAVIPKDASPEVKKIFSSSLNPEEIEIELAKISTKDPTAAAALQQFLPDDIGDLDLDD